MRPSELWLSPGFLHKWIKWGIIDHLIEDPMYDVEFTLEEAFEISIYVQLHLLWFKQEYLYKISQYISRYSYEINVENVNNKDFKPVFIKDIINKIKQGSTCFLLIDLSWCIEIIEDEFLFMVIMKDWYLSVGSAYILICANELLKKLWLDIKRNNNTTLKKAINKEFTKRVLGKYDITTSHNPKTEKVYNLMKKPNRTIVIDTNNTGWITSVREIEHLDWN